MICRELVSISILLIPMTGTASVGLWYSLDNFRGDGELIRLAQAAVCVAMISAFIWWYVWVLLHRKDSQMLVCYKEFMGDTNTFLAGSAVSRNLRQLDDLADRLGVRAIYDFGVERYLKKRVRWHHARELLASVTAILRHLRKNPAELKESRAIIEDLQKWQESLLLACERNVDICFHLTSPHAGYSHGIQEYLRPHSHF